MDNNGILESTDLSCPPKMSLNGFSLHLQEDDLMIRAPFFDGHLMLQYYQKLFHRYCIEGISEIWH
jgi:hypothetical protein